MITALKWKNHDILKDLELDFSKDDGTPYNTIILAGENGTGKTTILETIATFLSGGSIRPFEYIRYNIGKVVYTLKPIIGRDTNTGFHTRSTGDGGPVFSNIANNISNDKKDIRYYGVAYSKARSGFYTNPVKTSTTQDLDLNRSEIDKSNDFTSIKQLLVDLDSADSRCAKKIVEERNFGEEMLTEYDRTSKLSRFRTAFDNFWDNMKFDGITTNGSEIFINFKKHNSRITIDHLSTGEKQIVFRGAYLLKNLKRINGGVVLVDEPELSMHPKWQEKILEYYRGLFTIDGNQTTQLIVATHSEYVLKAALEDKENVLVIVLSDDGGKIEARKMTTPFVLPSITSAEINYMTFKVASIDYHILLYSKLLKELRAGNLGDCDKYIRGKISEDEKKKFAPPHTKDPRDKETTLPTYIRNAIDHPESGRTYIQKELEVSIELLLRLCESFAKPDESAAT